MTAMTTPAWATTIIQQMGGVGRLNAMIGAQHFLFDQETQTVQFAHMKGKSKINKVRITLTSLDLYDVEFWYVPSPGLMAKGTMPTQVGETHTMVYAEDLKPLFESETGLALSL